MNEHRHLKRFLRDKDRDVLGPGASGLACASLRQALARLDFGGGAPNFSDTYDNSLAKAMFDSRRRTTTLRATGCADRARAACWRA